MSILTKVESKGWQGRVFLASVTIALIIGGTTMLYPFLLMVSGALRSDMDSADMSIVPDYLVREKDLVRKFLETKYNYDPIMMNRFRQGQDYNFQAAEVPDSYNPQAVADLDEFITEGGLPDHWKILGGTELRQGISCVNHFDLVQRLRQQYNDDLSAYNAEMGSPIRSWWLLSVRLPRWAEARTIKNNAPLEKAYIELMNESPASEIALVNLTGLFLERLILPAYGMAGLDKFNEACSLSLESYSDFSIPQRIPPADQPVMRQFWKDFVFDDQLNLSFVRVDASDQEYRIFLQEKYGSIGNLRQYWHDADYAAFTDIGLPAEKDWISEPRREAYLQFLQTRPLESLKLVGPEFAWRAFLLTRYGDLTAVSQAHDLSATSLNAIKIPLEQLELKFVRDNARTLRKRYAWRNFRIVLRQMFVQGRAFTNTLIYVALCLLFALTIQPLVAYALSRFQPPGMWKIIFIFVATMAFPPMVGMIPQYLIIQKMNLLNTFIALVLPVTINGMLIFLLKGFFDSIPKDLYDAAVIDGASEFRIFWQITMAMSTPILAVVALQTFSGAWMAFMYPLIVCPDEKMHVLAVWLQQFQLQAPGTAVFASIIVASIPSLLIFIFAQRTIMRGIAVPSEK